MTVNVSLIVSVLSFLFGGGALAAIIKAVYKKVKAAKEAKKKEAACLALGVQALLRNELIDSYNHYSDKGYAPIYARENFENMYQRYHNLGANGVMDDMHEDFFKLPYEPVKKKG